MENRRLYDSERGTYTAFSLLLTLLVLLLLLLLTLTMTEPFDAVGEEEEELDNAVLDLHRAWHYPVKGKGGRKAVNLEEHRAKISAWLTDCLSQPNCVDVYNPKQDGQAMQVPQQVQQPGAASQGHGG